MKKDSRGRYMYDVANKNLLPSAKEMEQQQIVQAELGLAHNATMNVLSRLADLRYGEKYYDQVYSKEMERQANLLNEDQLTSEPPEQFDLNLPKKDNRHFKTDVSEDDIHNALQEGKEGTDKIKNKTELSEHLAEKIASGGELTDEEKQLKDILGKDVTDKLEERSSKADIDDIFSDLSDLRRQRDSLEGQENLTQDQENQLEELNRKIEALEQQKDDAFEHFDNKGKVDNSANIKPEDKDKFLAILNKITALRKRVKKFDDHYEVDGVRYKKVTDLIGDRIPEDIRNTTSTQAAVRAGYTIDKLVKAYFANDLDSDFRDALSTSISQDAYDQVIKSLDKIKQDLGKKGIEIVGSNVFAVDEDSKTAAEIDLLGIDKDGNFKIYEVQARRPDVYRQYGKRGLGIKIRDLDSKRLSMYRNMFANQYGVIPDEIAVKFPFEVKYDRNSPQGFIEDTKIKPSIRFTPVKNVEIKMKASEPIRLGSKFNSIDMTRIFLDTFLPTKEDQGKLQYIFRNVPFKQMLSGVKLKVRPAEEKFQERYNKQAEALKGKINSQGKIVDKSNPLKTDGITDYNSPVDNKYRPDQQLKFNQGAYESVRIVSDDSDLISLITNGSKMVSKDEAKRKGVNREYVKKLEEKLGVGAVDAYYKAKELAVANRDKTVEKIVKLSVNTIDTPNSDLGTQYQVKKFRDFRRKDEFGTPTEFDNLYSLVGNIEAVLSYEGQPIGYLSPVQTLAYKDVDGKFQILDENTDPKTYADVTGNDVSTLANSKELLHLIRRCIVI